MKTIIIILSVLFSVVSCSTGKLLGMDKENDKKPENGLVECRTYKSKWLADEHQTNGYFGVYYNSTPNQKQTIWIGKMAEVLDLDWSEPERQHILKMIKLMKDDIVKYDMLEKYPLYANDEINSWVDYAISKFGWSQSLTYEILSKQSLYQVMTADDKERILDIASYKYTPDSGLSEYRKFLNKWRAEDNIRYGYGSYTYCTPGQKQALWIGKMEELLDLDWSEPEKQHIISMLELITDNYEFFLLENRPQTVTDKMSEEHKKWIDYAKNELRWNDSLIEAMIKLPYLSFVMTADYKNPV